MAPYYHGGRSTVSCGARGEAFQLARENRYLARAARHRVDGDTRSNHAVTLINGGCSRCWSASRPPIRQRSDHRESREQEGAAPSRASTAASRPDRVGSMVEADSSRLAEGVDLELFGYERGAVAAARYLKGRADRAPGQTARLFIDEIGVPEREAARPSWRWRARARRAYVPAWCGTQKVDVVGAARQLSERADHEAAGARWPVPRRVGYLSS